MPDLDLARLAHELDRARRGLGPRRLELRRLLAMVDPQLRRVRNIEYIRLAGLRARLRSLDQRLDPAPLLAEVDESEKRLAVLDRRLLEAIARGLRKL